MKPRVKVMKVHANLNGEKLHRILGLTWEDIYELGKVGISNTGSLAQAVLTHKGDLRKLSVPGVTFDEEQSIRITDALGRHLRKNYPDHPTTALFANWDFESSQGEVAVSTNNNTGPGTTNESYFQRWLHAKAGTFPK